MKIHRLEAIRGVIAIYIALVHSVSSSRPFLLSFGQEAVIIFFILSGFVIEYSSGHLIYHGFLNYFSKRFLRIYPILAILFIVMILTGQLSLSSWSSWQNIFGHFLMLQDYPAKPNIIVRVNDFSTALWSLHYEWWFYMLYFPISKYLKRDLQLSLIGIVGIVSALIYLAFPNSISRILFYFPIWWSGVVLARLYIQYRYLSFKMIKMLIFYISLISAVLFIPCIQILIQGDNFKVGFHPFLEFRHLISSLLIMLIAIGWQKIEWIGFSRLLSWGRYVAPISYSFYIAHEPLFFHASYLHAISNVVIEKILYFIFLLLFCYSTELWLYPHIRNVSYKIGVASQY